jgi:hypothetical protein
MDFFTNPLQWALTQIEGGKKAAAIEAEVQPALNVLNPILLPILTSYVSAQVAKSSTLSAILGDLEKVGVVPSSFTNAAGTSSSNSGIDTAVAALMLQISKEVSAPTSATPMPVTPTVAQVVTVFNSAIGSLGIPSADYTTLDTAFTSAAGSLANMTEAQGTQYLDDVLATAGLPVSADAAFVSAFQSAWSAAGYPVPNS